MKVDWHKNIALILIKIQVIVSPMRILSHIQQSIHPSKTPYLEIFYIYIFLFVTPREIYRRCAYEAETIGFFFN